MTNRGDRCIWVSRYIFFVSLVQKCLDKIKLVWYNTCWRSGMVYCSVHDLNSSSGYCIYCLESKDQYVVPAGLVKRLREGLEFYSHSVRYHVHHDMGYGLQKDPERYSAMDVDSGQRARDLLEELNK